MHEVHYPYHEGKGNVIPLLFSHAMCDCCSSLSRSQWKTFPFCMLMSRLRSNSCREQEEVWMQCLPKCALLAEDLEQSGLPFDIRRIQCSEKYRARPPSPFPPSRGSLQNPWCWLRSRPQNNAHASRSSGPWFWRRLRVNQDLTNFSDFKRLANCMSSCWYFWACANFHKCFVQNHIYLAVFTEVKT